MQGLTIQFAYDWAPWLFFLLIPAFALTLIPYFRLSKRYRRTRNRIISMVFHLVIMVLAISALTGMNFRYEVTNDENEIILLVDVSDTEAPSEARRDEFIETVINESGYDGFKVGVVTFGFTQEYAVPLTYDTDTIFESYKSAVSPDTTATDIAAALRYTKGLFSNPQSGKIVLITDAKETDEEAINVIRSVSAQGIKVDTVHIDSTFDEDNVQIVGVRFPEQHVGVNQTFNLSVDLVTRKGTESTVIELSDNGKTFQFLTEDDGKPKNLVSGSQSVNFRMSFETEGLHEIRVKVTDAADGMAGNNEYVTYYYLEVYDRVLIIDHGADATESDALENLLSPEGALSQGDVKYDVTRLSLAEFSDKYDTVDEIRAFDQVILNNISNDDLTGLPVPDWVDKSLGEEEQKNWFVNVLRSYVYDYGGGLFTTGGTSGEKDQEGNDISHAYNKDDLYNTRYQEMLPVQAIDYTPPVGVMLLVDVSGSVAGKLEWIRQGAHSCLDALTERDYIGIMTFTTTQRMVLQLTSRTEETKIREAIDSGIDDSQNGSTTFYMPIERACRALIAEQNIARRHVVIVTDGQPTDSAKNYLDLVRKYHRENEITFSVVMIDAGAGDQQMMKDLIDAAEGNYERNLHLCETQREIMSEMREDLNVSELKSFNPEPFKPRITEPSSTIVSGVEYGTERDRYQMEAELGGFYGVKARSAANVLLVGDYNVPIYAQWTFGEGTVGSFMCDLSGNWSSAFMEDPNGAKLLRNIVGNLMPTENIRPNDVVIDLREENYISNVSVYANLAAGERIEGVLIDTADPTGTEISLNVLPETTEGAYIYVTAALGADNGYTRCAFVIKRPGVYQLVFRKLDAEGNVITSAEAFKAFSYSKEYELLTEESGFDPVGYLTELSERGKGTLVAEDEAYRIFADFVTTLEKHWDPRLTFMIIAMVLFLADIAVRKFKFKWPHELIRESKERKALRK